MIIVISIIYLLIGVILNFIHPEMVDINPMLQRIARPTIDDYINQGSFFPKWKRIIAIIIIRFVVIVFGPAVTLFDFIYKPLSKAFNNSSKPYEEDNYDYLYFTLMKGAGVVKCQLCTYSSTVLGNIDGGPGSGWNQKGYQCQSCGRFHMIELADSLEKLLVCDCGGELNRNHFVFCPECRHNHLIYEEQYICDDSDEQYQLN